MHRADARHLDKALGTRIAHSPDAILTQAGKLGQLHHIPNALNYTQLQQVFRMHFNNLHLYLVLLIKVLLIIWF